MDFLRLLHGFELKVLNESKYIIYDWVGCAFGDAYTPCQSLPLLYYSCNILSLLAQLFCQQKMPHVFPVAAHFWISECMSENLLISKFSHFK